jgi:hypothetical protein
VPTSRKWILPACFVVALSAQPLIAGDWAHVKQACKNAKAAPDRATIEDCAIKFYGLEPIGPQIGNIAPGSSIGLGLRAIKTINHPDRRPDYISRQSQITARGLYSLKNFYFMEGKYEFHMPAIGQANAKTATFPDQITFSVFASRMNLAEQPFYGLGPDSVRSGLAEYRQQEDKVGGSVDWPIMSWLAADGAIEWLAPHILGVSKTSPPSVPQFYGNAGAPGVSSQPTFLESGASLRFHTPVNASQTWQHTEVRAGYQHFTDLGAGSNTFDRFEAKASSSFELRRDIGPEFDRPWWKDAMCDAIAGQQCRLGNIVLNGLVTTSYTSDAHVVPFYYQPTLGGTDINGVDTLRGLSDYRLRAPNRMLLQAEFYHDVYLPVGIYGFYDVGEVALQAGDLGFSHLRHDVGIRVFFRVQNTIVLRGYIGFGAGESTHMNFKLPNAF